jgi:glutathione peroxidase
MIRFFMVTALFLFAQGFGSAQAHPLSGLQLVDLSGKAVAAQAYEGKAVLVVNVASRCGFTPQYEGLQKVYERYKDKGLTILGVPCNQFGWQEPGDSKEIKSFCTTKYNVTFPILQKQKVKGDDKTPLYQKLVMSKVGDKSEVRWNFEKFLLDRSGKVTARFRSATKPQSPEMIKAIEAALLPAKKIKK